LILGASGRLGAALANRVALGKVVALDRSAYRSWTRPGCADDILSYLDKAGVPDNAQILIASGVTDPARSDDDHQSVNFQLPRNVIQAARQRGLKVVTFGTIMELVANEDSRNPYLRSKIRLTHLLQEMHASGADILHLRIHTLYGGGPPARFMFIGQIREAIDRGTEFEMSDGSQLREYHHVEDEAAAIARLIRCDASGFLDLSHGQPLRLRDLAIYIFTAFGCLDKLKIGARPMAEQENLHTVFRRPPLLQDISFRDARAAIVEYLRAYIPQ
jgi:nucleoside-diphosphate-sugar epimerase